MTRNLTIIPWIQSPKYFRWDLVSGYKEKRMIWYRLLMWAIALVFIIAGYFVFKTDDASDPLYGFLALVGFIIFAVGALRRNPGE